MYTAAGFKWRGRWRGAVSARRKIAAPLGDGIAPSPSFCPSANSRSCASPSAFHTSSSLTCLPATTFSRTVPEKMVSLCNTQLTFSRILFSLICRESIPSKHNSPDGERRSEPEQQPHQRAFPGTRPADHRDFFSGRNVHVDFRKRVPFTARIPIGDPFQRNFSVQERQAGVPRGRNGGRVEHFAEPRAVHAETRHFGNGEGTPSEIRT